MTPFGRRLGDTMAETYQIARSGLRHFRSDDGSAYWWPSNRSARTAVEYMACARDNLWRVAYVGEGSGQ